MPGSLTIPNRIGLQAGPTVAAALFDGDWQAIADYVNAREVSFGALSARPAAGVAGRYYYAQDVPALFVDTGTVWLDTSRVGVINPAVFGFGPTSTASVNRAALQQAVDALPASGGAIQITSYGNHIDAAINVAKPLVVLGPGTTEVSTPGPFVLYLDTVGQVGFNVTSKGPFIMQDFSIFGAATTTHVLLNGPAGSLNGTESSRFLNVVFYGGARHIQSLNATFCAIDKCLFWLPSVQGVLWENQVAPDQNGPTITNCVFFDDTKTAQGVSWASGGSLRVQDCQFLGFLNPVVVDPNYAGTTQEVWILDNAITAFGGAGAGVLVQRTTGAGTLSYVRIQRNLIATLDGVGHGFGISFPTNDAAYVSEVFITDNAIADVDVGINLVGGTRYRIEQNELLRMTTGVARGISLSGANASVYIGANRYTAVTTPIVGAGADLSIVDTRLGFTVAALPAGVNVGSVAYAVDAFGPGDGGFTGYGMVATAGGTGAPVVQTNGSWRVG